MSEAGKIKSQRRGMRMAGGRGKSYEEIRRQALRITNALGAQARGNAPETYPGETNFWAGAGTPRGRAISTIAGRYLDNIRETNGLPLEYDLRDRRANTRYPRSVYARRNNRWE